MEKIQNNIKSTELIPLVTVIIRSYNHEKYLKEAIDSVLQQTYKNIQLIVIDDASSDGSAQVIDEVCKEIPEINPIFLKENVGNCRSFNIAFSLAKGKYIIDLSADDLLLPQRIESQVSYFESLDENFAMIFSDAVLINENGDVLRNFYKRNNAGKLIDAVPSGNIFKDILQKHFICTPTMMYRTSVLDELHGFDSELVYEDFDFWVRAGRKYEFAFQNEVLTARRIVIGSQSEQFSKEKSEEIHLSTYKVCKKALNIVRSNDEKLALITRVRYEMRQCYFTKNYRICKLYGTLLKSLNDLQTTDKAILKLAKNKISMFKIYSMLKKQRN